MEIWTVKVAAIVNPCAQGVGKPGFRLLAPALWTMCRVLEGEFVPYELTVHSLAGALLSSAPVLHCERNPACAHSPLHFVFPFHEAWLRSGTALPACLSYDVEGIIFSKLLFRPLLQKQSRL
jgi:hypothetical protein